MTTGTPGCSATSNLLIGDLQHRMGRRDEFESASERAIPHLEAAVALKPDDARNLNRLVTCHSLLAGIARARGRFAEEERHYLRAATTAERLLALWPDTPGFRRLCGDSERMLGEILWRGAVPRTGWPGCASRWRP